MKRTGLDRLQHYAPILLKSASIKTSYRLCLNIKGRIHSVSNYQECDDLSTTHTDSNSPTHISRNDDEVINYFRSLPDQFIRAIDPVNYNETTGQRIDVAFDLKNGKPFTWNRPKHRRNPKIDKFHLKDGYFRILWDDGIKSSIPLTLIQDSFERWNPASTNENRIYWHGLNENTVRSSSLLCTAFDHVINSKEGQSSAIRALYQYGIVLVTETPVEDNGASVAALAASIGGGSIKDTSSILYHYKRGQRVTTIPHGTDGPMKTLFGKVWSTNAADQDEGASTADSAYGTEGLLLHTDMTYYRDPPGLQIFTMKQQATVGGESIICDGFAAANRLRTTSPESFDLLSRTIRIYRSIDQQSGWYLQARGPVISVHNGEICMIRHNDLDRLPDLPPPVTSPMNYSQFYDKLEAAHEEWNKILASDDMRLIVPLKKGETIIVANQVSFLRMYKIYHKFILILPHEKRCIFLSVAYMADLVFHHLMRIHDQSLVATLVRMSLILDFDWKDSLVSRQFIRSE